MLEKTWIGATGQRWKVYVIFGLLAITVVWLAATIAFLDRLPSDLGGLVLLILFLMIIGFISWTFWSLSCPFCGNRVIWTVLRTLPHQESVHVAFFFLTNCPACKRSFFSGGSTTIPPSSSRAH